MEPPTKLTIRNDFFHYGADGDGSVRSGLVEAEADVKFNLNMLTALYKPDVKILGASYAFGTLIPLTHVDIDARVNIGPSPTSASQHTTVCRSGLNTRP